jgi:hypothetical protein
MTRHSSSVPQRVVGGDTSAQQRRGFVVCQAIRNGGNSFGWRNHVLGIAAIKTECRDFLIATNDEIAAPAWITYEAVPSMPAHADTLAGLPLRHVWADGVHAPCNFVPWYAGVLQPGPKSFFHQHVTMTNAAGFDLDANLSASGLRDGTLNQFEVTAGSGYLDNSHFLSSLIRR